MTRATTGHSIEHERGLALMAVLFALTLLMLLSLPFAVSMRAGADAAMRDLDQASTEQASASVRDLMLAEAAMSHPALDLTPLYDGLDEYPRGVIVPDAFGALEDGGRVLLGGEVEDLQRYLSLDAASPLLLANVIGTVSRLAEDLEADAGAVALRDASGLPEQGYVWVNNEVIRYEQRDGNSLIGLERGLFRSQGFADGSEPIATDALVLDYRCVLAAAWPFFGRGDGTRRQRQPWRSAAEMLEIQDSGLGTFTAAEIDAFERVFVPDAQAETSAVYGRPERVFNDLVAGMTRTLLVKSAVHIGAGSTVRIRDLQTGAVEYGLLMAATQSRAQQEVLLPSMFELQLLMPVAQSFAAVDTVVEPLVPPPVNINTASEEALAAVFAEVRRSDDLRVPDANHRRPAAPPFVDRQLAEELAAEVAAARGGRLTGGSGPYTGWQDLVERLFSPRLAAESNNTARNMWVVLYRALQSGRDSVLEMGTSPICFRSGPWVTYRAAASRSRSLAAAGVTGRHERVGHAAAVPGFRLEHAWTTQAAFEQAFELDRRAPFWITSPINLGHLQPGVTGNDPAARYFPHLVPVAFPGLGLGAPRYAVDDPADSGIEPSVATAPPNAWPQINSGLRPFDTFAQANHRRGREIRQEGPYLMRNTGPQDRGAAGNTSGNGRHDQISFPFSAQSGFMARFGVQFWLEPQTLAGRVLFDHGDGDPDRNRMTLLGRDGNLTLELIDEAGIDPNPGDSPAGVQRTSTQLQLPLAELALPADTAVHVNMAATSGRASDLSLFVDGMVRARPQYVTYLTAALPPFDPTLANNQNQPGQAPGSQSGNNRYLDIQVESTDGFPQVGVLRIGLELFEYSAVNGNTFQCRYRDSLGGRGARQMGREHRPSIPTDANGEPTVDINDPQFANVNLDVFPEHPAGSMVELYGYSALVSEDVGMMVGETALAGGIGEWAVARGFVNNPETITVSNPNTSRPVGMGISETWSGELLLADPVPTGDDQPPNAAQESISNAFATGGGYALLIQRRSRIRLNLPGQISGTDVYIGGVELIRYAGRQGNKLTGIQRGQTLPGDDSFIDSSQYDGSARKFISDWDPMYVSATDATITYDHMPTRILWVVPISLPVQNAGVLWDPSTTQLTEWVQLLPAGDATDTEWVRYDTIADNVHLCRANRASWSRLQFTLAQSSVTENIDVGPLGANGVNADTLAPWLAVAPTSGHVGYSTQQENLYPQIRAARASLQFRGDPTTGTSSHPHASSKVMQCQRLQLHWGNYGAHTGRLGRHDRVALVQGSIASGSTRPTVEWHTVNWQWRRFGSDNLQNNNNPPELLGPWPFQLVAFRAGLRSPLLGPPRGTIIEDPRAYDRVVKFPSGELPAAYCPNPTIGAGVGGEQAMQGVIDEVGVVEMPTRDVVLDEIFQSSAGTFTVNRYYTPTSAGAQWMNGVDLTGNYPQYGGLVQIDDEILAYTQHQDGVFTVSQNGRGLLNTEARTHDRGARVKFLIHRPASILAGGVGANESVLPLQDLGALPRTGTVLLGRELLHYTWQRRQANQLEMPRWYPPGEDRDERAARGMFRGRYGTVAQGASSGDVVIEWPFRYWDRHVERSDDPELAYFQMTSNAAPSFFRSLRYRQETRDARVELICTVRTDGQAAWHADPATTPGLWQFRGRSEGEEPRRLDRQASRIEVRFATAYKPGAIDLAAFSAHGWKTAARVEDVHVEYEGRSRIFSEEVRAR